MSIEKSDIFSETVTKLHEARAQLVDRLAIIDNAISAMGDAAVLSPTQSVLNGRRARRTMSAAARKRIGLRMKKLWAARRAAKRAAEKKS